MLVGVGIFQHADPAAARHSAGRQPALLELDVKLTRMLKKAIGR